MIRSSILGSSSSEGSSIDSLSSLSLGLLLGLSSGLLSGLPTLVKTPALVSSSLSQGLVLPLSIALGITISKLFRTSRRESTIGIDSLFLGLPAYLRSSRCDCVLVINKFAELP